MTNLDSIFKSRDVTLPIKAHLVKAMVFPVVMYTCEFWTVKKAEHRRINAFELGFGRRLLRVPSIARRSNWSILKQISPGCCLEGMMLKLKLQYFSHLMWRVDSLEKTLMLGGIGGRRRRGWQRMAGCHHWLDGRESGWTPGVGDGQGGLECCDSWGRKDLDTTERLNWTECICFNTVLSNHHAISFSHWVQKSVLYACVSFVAQYAGQSVSSFLIPYMIICSLFFSLMWCITWIFLNILKNPCIPEIKASCPWCIILSMCCWILFTHILLKILHLYSAVILACNFIYLWNICLVWYQLAL